MEKVMRTTKRRSDYCEPGTVFVMVLLLSTIVIGLLFLIFAPKKSFSEEENRFLEKPPAFQFENILDGSFMTSFENYVGDHFIFRQQFIQLNTAVQYGSGRRDVGSNYGKTPAEGGVYFGFAQHLYEVLLPNRTDIFENNAKALHYFGQKSGLPFYILPVPSGSQAQPENLPPYAPNHSQKEELAALQKNAGGSTRVVDVFDRLSLAGGEDYYYKTDHHWNSFGAYEGYAALAQAMGIEPLPRDDFDWKPLPEPFYGTLYSKSLAPWQKPDEILLPVPHAVTQITQQTGKQVYDGLYREQYYNKKDKYSLFLGGNHSVDIVRNPEGKEGKLLILKDSYANSMIPFLAMHFSEIHIIDLRYYNQNIYQYLTENHIDQAAAIYSIKQLCDVSVSGKLTRK